MIFVCSQANILGRDVIDLADAGTGARTQAERREAARLRIVDASIRIVAERGLDQLTLAEAGEAAGYSRGLAGHYFGSKDELEALIAEHIVGLYREETKRLQDEQSGLAGVLAIIEHYLKSAGEKPESTRALHAVLGAAMGKPDLASAIARLNRESVKTFAKHIETGIARKEIRKTVDAETAAQLILAGLRGTVALWLINPKSVDLKRLNRENVNSVRRMLAP
jgi:AcrR family transcriptional regulator